MAELRKKARRALGLSGPGELWLGLIYCKPNFPAWASEPEPGLDPALVYAKIVHQQPQFKIR